MQEDLPKHPIIRLQRAHRLTFDATVLFIYLSLVYLWSLNLHPLGRDYQLLHLKGEGLPPLVSQLFSGEIALFGSRAWGYHLVNCVLLYACMLTLYALVRLTVTEGPIWLGTLAATLFMANPVHSDAILNLSGIVDLLPALLALIALTLYVHHTTNPRPWTLLAALAAFALAILPFQANLGLWLIIIACEAFIARPRNLESIPRLIPFLAIAAGAHFFHAQALTLANLDPAGMFAPLYFILYNIGFLPESAQTFHAWPWLGWVASAVVAAILLLIHRKLRHPVFLFGIAAALGCRLFQGGNTIDPVHLIGGGQLLLATALFSIALVVLFRRIMDHPKWKRNVISFTTLLCLIFFFMQIRVIRIWNDATEEVKTFQAAAQAGEFTTAKPLGVLPDYRYHRGAPLCLSDSIACGTPFSTAIPHQSLLPIHRGPEDDFRVKLERLTPTEATLQVEAKDPLVVATWPYNLAGPLTEETTDHTIVRVLDSSSGALHLQVTPRNGALPQTTLPLTPDDSSF